MRLIKIVLLGLLLGIVNLALAGGPIDPILPKGFVGPWQTVKVGGGMTVRVPGKLIGTSLDLNKETQKHIDLTENYSLDNTNEDDYSCLAAYTVYNKGIMVDLDGAADSQMEDLKTDSRISDIKINRKHITRFKLKGILLSGSMILSGKKDQIETEVFVNRNVIWMFVIIDSNPKPLVKINKAIFDSINIKAN